MKALYRKEVMQRLGYSSTRFDALMKEPGFPVAIKLGARTSAWLEGDVNGWIASRLRVDRGKAVGS